MNPRTIAYKIYDPASGRRKERPIMAKYSKRVALIATSRDLTKEIEGIIIKAMKKESYSDAVADINVTVRQKFGIQRIIPLSLRPDEEVITEFAKEFGEISPLVGAILEYNEDCENTKRSGF